MIASSDEVFACNYAKWSSLFQRKKVLISSRIVELPSQFIEYLKTDGITLPEKVSATAFGDDQLSDDDDSLTVESLPQNSPTMPSFPDLDKLISKTIKELGGKVFIKLNWSAPIDATWINGESCMCRSIGDVYLLLKASSRISLDLQHEEMDDSGNTIPTKYALVLKKWATLHPAMGFRCFIFNTNLVGICQRDCSAAYDFLEGEIPRLRPLISELFQTTVKETFPLKSYTMDVYVDKNNKVWLLDFNVFGSPTNPLLFEWSHLSKSPSATLPLPDAVPFLVVKGSYDILASDLGAARGPLESVDCAFQDFFQFQKLCRAQHATYGEESDDSEDER